MLTSDNSLTYGVWLLQKEDFKDTNATLINLHFQAKGTNVQVSRM